MEQRHAAEIDRDAVERGRDGCVGAQALLHQDHRGPVAVEAAVAFRKWDRQQPHLAEAGEQVERAFAGLIERVHALGRAMLRHHAIHGVEDLPLFASRREGDHGGAAAEARAPGSLVKILSAFSRSSSARASGRRSIAPISPMARSGSTTGQSVPNSTFSRP